MNPSKTLELENVSKLKTLESNGAARPAGQQPARLGWGMSLNRLRSAESPSSSLMATAKEDIKTENKKTPIEREEVINNDQLPGSQGSKRAALVGGGAVPASTAASPITLGNDSGPKRLSWGMSLRQPVGIGKSISKDSPRCRDTPAESLFHQTSSGRLLGDSPLKEPPFPTHPTRGVILSDTFDSVSTAAKTKAAMCDKMGGDEEGLQLVVHNRWEKGYLNMPCKRKKEGVERQQTPTLFKTTDHSMILSPVETKAKEMVQNKNEDFPTRVTAIAAAVAVAANISDGLEDLVSHQPLLPTEKRIRMKLGRRVV